jgi:hypothetical protein
VVGECDAHTLDLSQEDRDRHAAILAQVREVNNYIPKAGSQRSEQSLDDHLPEGLTLTLTQLMASLMILPPQSLLWGPKQEAHMTHTVAYPPSINKLESRRSDATSCSMVFCRRVRELGIGSMNILGVMCNISNVYRLMDCLKKIGGKRVNSMLVCELVTKPRRLSLR